MLECDVCVVRSRKHPGHVGPVSPRGAGYPDLGKRCAYRVPAPASGRDRHPMVKLRKPPLLGRFTFVNTSVAGISGPSREFARPCRRRFGRRDYPPNVTVRTARVWSARIPRADRIVARWCGFVQVAPAAGSAGVTAGGGGGRPGAVPLRRTGFRMSPPRRPRGCSGPLDDRVRWIVMAVTETGGRAY